MITRRTLLTTAVAAGGIARAARLSAQETVADAAAMAPGDFSWHPERAPRGAVAVIASIPEQRVHVYRNGVRIGVSTCSTGRPGHETPTGVFTVLQKDADHRSSTYNNAPMPNMNRLTWDGIALHAGNLPGYPASHGCIRLPLEFSERLFDVTHVGTPVIISGASSDPWDLIHPGLVLHAFAEDELEQAVAALGERSHPADWTDGAEYPVTTVLATGADRRLLIMEDGDIVMEDTIAIPEDGPLGEHVLILRDSHGGDLAWTGVTHHPDPLHPLWPEEQVLNRLRVSSEANAHLAQRLHPGLTFVVSDLPSTPDRRSGENFVIMTGGVWTSPRPVQRP